MIKKHSHLLFCRRMCFLLNSFKNTISAYENTILTRNPGKPRIDLEGK